MRKLIQKSTIITFIIAALIVSASYLSINFYSNYMMEKTLNDVNSVEVMWK